MSENLAPDSINVSGCVPGQGVVRRIREGCFEMKMGRKQRELGKGKRSRDI